ncbi:MAG TPA: phosphotransferase family protein [Acidimicrobiales bacterium]|jgi:aminoglycoside phosphotransferase (APT) family kinase protein|nr:phosphotransferase family protein [Acidimicrobiales bacterium]
MPREVAEVPGVDLERLTAWMDQQGLGDGPIEHTSLIAGGTQNVLLRFTRAGRTYVLRRPPLHKRSNSDETMRREARVLAALATSDVPHPALIAANGELDTLGAAFYLMEPIDGFNPTVELPEPHRSDPTVQRAMGLSMADAIAALGRIDVEAAGLAGLGRPAGWLERQVDRWRSHLASYDAIEGYRGADLPGVEDVAAWLDERRPTDWSPGLIHGDFHFANVLVRRDAGELAAVVDWELTTIGDPLLDLGHLLATWPKNTAGGMAAVGGGLADLALPSPDELVDRYADGSPRDVSHAGWYQVLACYRLGIILEGTNARADAGQAPRATGDLLHAHAVNLFEQALTLVNG